MPWLNLKTYIQENIVVDTVLADSTSVSFSDIEPTSAKLFIPTGSGLTLLTFHGSYDNASFVPLYTSANVAVTMAVAQTRTYDLPAQVRECLYWKAIGNVDGVVHLLYRRLF